MELWHILEDLDAADVLESFLPFAKVKISCGKHNKVSAVLWHELNALKIVLLNELSEVLADDLLLNIALVLTEVWNF